MCWRLPPSHLHENWISTIGTSTWLNDDAASAMICTRVCSRALSDTQNKLKIPFRVRVTSGFEVFLQSHTASGWKLGRKFRWHKSSHDGFYPEDQRICVSWANRWDHSRDFWRFVSKWELIYVWAVTALSVHDSMDSFSRFSLLKALWKSMKIFLSKKWKFQIFLCSCQFSHRISSESLFKNSSLHSNYIKSSPQPATFTPTPNEWKAETFQFRKT